MQRSVPLSGAQAILVRHMLQTICTYAQTHRGGMFSSDSLPKEEIRALSAWEEASRAWPMVLGLDEAVSAAVDLSGLYLREYAMELVQKAQFPMSSSLPWILAVHAAKSKSAVVLPAAVLPLLLYNQAGQRAVTELRRRHLRVERGSRAAGATGISAFGWGGGRGVVDAGAAHSAADRAARHVADEQRSAVCIASFRS